MVTKNSQERKAAIKARLDNEIVLFSEVEEYKTIDEAKLMLSQMLENTKSFYRLNDDPALNTGEPVHQDVPRFNFSQTGNMYSNFCTVQTEYKLSIRHKNNVPYIVRKTTETNIGISFSGKFHFRNEVRDVVIARRNKDRAWIITSKTKNNKLGFLSYNLTISPEGLPSSSTDDENPSIIAQIAGYDLSDHKSVEDAAKMHIDISAPKKKDIYPIFSALESHVYLNPRTLTSNFINAFAYADTPAKLTHNLFGARAVRKDLVREVAQADLKTLAYVHALRHKDVPVDWYVSAFKQIRENSVRLASYAPRFRELDAWARDLDLISRRRLLVTMWRKPVGNELRALRHLPKKHYPTKKAANDSRIKKAIDSLGVAPITHVDSLTDLENQANTRDNTVFRVISQIEEDRYAAKQRRIDRWRASSVGQHLAEFENEQRRIRAERDRQEREARFAKEEETHADRVAHYKALEKAIRKYNTSGLKSNPKTKLIIAKDVSTLNEWSDLMDNCIRQYASSLQDRSQMLLGLYQHDEASDEFRLVANLDVEMARRKLSTNEKPRVALSQFLGRHNSKVDLDIRQPVIDFLNDQNVDTESYWGDDND